MEHMQERRSIRRAAAFIMALLLAALLPGCTAERAAKDGGERTEAAAPATAIPAPEATAAASKQPLTPKPSQPPTAEPLPQDLAPMTADMVAGLTPSEANAVIESYLPSSVAYGNNCSYDADTNVFSLTLYAAGEREDLLVKTINPVLACGVFPRIEVTLDSEDVTAVPTVGAHLILTEYEGDETVLNQCTDVTALTILEYDADRVGAFPPNVKELTIVEGSSYAVTLYSLYGEDETVVLTGVQTLNIGSKDTNACVELSDEDGHGFACLPALQNLNLYYEGGEMKAAMIELAKAAPSIQKINGVPKSQLGPFAGWALTQVNDYLSEQVYAFNSDGTAFPFAYMGNTLPASIPGNLYIDVGGASSCNLKENAVTWGSATAGNEGYCGIPPQYLYDANTASESAAYLAYIYEADTVVGYYGDRANEDWGYLADTCVFVVEMASGRVYQKTVKSNNPPPTDEDDTYGTYEPDVAVAALRALLPKELGPYAGCSMSDAYTAIYAAAHPDNYDFYATEGLPAAITGPVRVAVCDDGDFATGQYLEPSYEGEDYYGIPGTRIVDDCEPGEAGFLIVICGFEYESKTYDSYTFGYTAETHLVIVDMSTGHAWHKLFRKETPPAVNPDENSSYHACTYPLDALSSILGLIR